MISWRLCCNFYCYIIQLLEHTLNCWFKAQEIDVNKNLPRVLFFAFKPDASNLEKDWSTWLGHVPLLEVGQLAHRHEKPSEHWLKTFFLATGSWRCFLARRVTKSYYIYGRSLAVTEIVHQVDVRSDVRQNHNSTRTPPHQILFVVRWRLPPKIDLTLSNHFHCLVYGVLTMAWYELIKYSRWRPIIQSIIPIRISFVDSYAQDTAWNLLLGWLELCSIETCRNAKQIKLLWRLPHLWLWGKFHLSFNPPH